MLRSYWRVIALVAIIGCLSMTAQAADTTLTLACKGTLTDTTTEGAKPETISMGIIVNFTDRTVQGFGTPGLFDYPVKITAWNNVTVAFSGSEKLSSSTLSIRGTIDRVTGDLEATEMQTLANNNISLTSYALKCRPAQRMF